ncbi:MAG: signal peptidase I [Planctomycetota bacterium]
MMSGRKFGEISRRVAKARGLPPATRDRIAREVNDHLEDARQEYESIGHSHRKAVRLAARDFGDVRKTRTDLGRAWRGRRTVLFPETPGEGKASFWIYDARLLAVILAVVLLLRWQVVAAYHIPTKSMEPTLHGHEIEGDRILVNKLYFRFYAPDRWQIAVFADDRENRNLIKRVVGLPGEILTIENGDLYADGEILRKPPEVEADLLVPVFLEDRDVTAQVRGYESSGLDSWEAVGEWTETESGFFAVPDEEGKACLAWNDEIRNDVPGDRAGSQVVGDLVLSFVVTPDRGAETVGAVLREGIDEFQVLFPVGEGETVLRRNREVVASAPGVHLVEQRPAAIRFANVDDLVSVRLDGVEVLRFEVPSASTADDADDSRPPAEFGVRGMRSSALFSHVALSRDIHYLTGHEDRYRIPDDHYFMMGDNSGNSEDSRSKGSVSSSRLIGRPLMVIWPLKRVKVVR